MMMNSRKDPNTTMIIPRKQIESVQFGFYTDKQVRERSVVQVTVAQAFDPNLTPLSNGLYDLRMGPQPQQQGNSSNSSTIPCPTCAMVVSNCPGHYGHIELVVPVYHPMLYMELIQLLRSKCYACHKIRAPIRPIQIVQAKLILLSFGQYEQVDQLDQQLMSTMYHTRDSTSQDETNLDQQESSSAASKQLLRKNKMKQQQAAAQAMDQILQPILALQQHQQEASTSTRNGTISNNNKNQPSYIQIRQKELQKELWKLCIQTKVCTHCGAHKPKIRQDQYNKIFQCVLSKKIQRIHTAENIYFHSALQSKHQQQPPNKPTPKASSPSRNNNNNISGSATPNPTNNRSHTDPSQSLSSVSPSGRSIVEVTTENDQQDQSFLVDDNVNHEDDDGDDAGDDEDDDDNDDVDDDNDNHHDDDNDVEEKNDDQGDDDDDDDDDNEDDDDHKKKKQTTTTNRDKFMTPSEIQAQIQKTWELMPSICQLLMNGRDADMFFLRTIAVPPNRFRPAMHMDGMVVEHSQTQYLSRIIQLNETVKDYFMNQQESRAYTTWIELQTAVNCFMDSSKDPSGTPSNQVAPGIRQLLERKEGLFRKHMMGKRVDYAARSVISPDPYVGTNEIGLPYYFCSILTYPTPVNDLNISTMRQLVENGIDQYPGARWVELPTGRRLDLSKMKINQRKSVAAQLLTHVNKSNGIPAIVGRQLQDGDYVLMNRQPTLHKPGIMAHRVRVLHNRAQRTIRMHYSNCDAYNADFDGDEMNCHFPQNDLARAEAQYIAKTDLQYIVPTDGSPLRGLIQDHVVGGVKLTKKDTFLAKWEYQQLVFAALASLPGLEVIGSDKQIETVPPAIVRPRELWTGKQVITTILLHLRKVQSLKGSNTSDLPGLSMQFKSKTPESAFGAAHEEHLVLVNDGELVRGVLDKAAFGATSFCLIHGVYEAYGPEKAGLLLNAFGRLFTAFIQQYSGHSCRMEDLILTQQADNTRRRLIKEAYNIGARAANAWVVSEGGRVQIAPLDPSAAIEPLGQTETALTSSRIAELLCGSDGKARGGDLDAHMQATLNQLSSDIVKRCLPSGLAVQFPMNTFSIMTTTGAKGSIVNQSQVTCALGQQALEGRRVPRMCSGRTLPSFAPFDPNPRADGFVMDRFLTGIRPQEYYFHCMAGREGLVDTAVKTSRSGYLQRCLVKHLEELMVSYDYTVRNAEGGVIQFLYGEDALDPTKAPYLDCSDRSIEFLAQNYHALQRQNAALSSPSLSPASEDCTRDAEVKQGERQVFREGEFVLARRLRSGSRWIRGAFLLGWKEAVVLKFHRKRNSVDLKYLCDGYEAKYVPIEADIGRCGGRKTDALSCVATIVRSAVPDPIISSRSKGHRLGTSGKCVSERVADTAVQAMRKNKQLQRILLKFNLTPKELSQLISAKFSCSLCSPGEAVGCIAAQSLGEPSTQMTLNTFHLAGAGANVTLGIPRLREILMTASRELKTPTMSVPICDSVTEAQAARLARLFTKLTLIELISGDRGIVVTEKLENDSNQWRRSYYVTLKLHPALRIKETFGLSLSQIARVVGSKFVPLLSQYMKTELRRSGTESEVGVAEFSFAEAEALVGDGDSGDKKGQSTTAQRNEESDEDDIDDENDEKPGDEDGADMSRYDRTRESVSYGDDDSDDESGHVEQEKPILSEQADNSDVGDGIAFSGKGLPVVNKRTNSIILQPLHIDPSAHPLLLVELIEKAAKATVVRSRKNIHLAYVNEEKGRGRCLQTAGVNFEEIWTLEEVDHRRLISNDIWAMRCAYGVEVARSSIVSQISSVFAAYGIEINPRHLSLIADYMSFGGGFKPMNRIGMESCSSAFLQMSFETTVNFLRQAALANTHDTLKSPSANIVVGRPIRHGTGSFSILTKV